MKLDKILYDYFMENHWLQRDATYIEKAYKITTICSALKYSGDRLNKYLDQRPLDYNIVDTNPVSWYDATISQKIFWKHHV